MRRLPWLLVLLIGCGGDDPKLVEPDLYSILREGYTDLSAISGVIEEVTKTGEETTSRQRTFVAEKAGRIAVLIVEDGVPRERLMHEDETLTQISHLDRIVTTQLQPLSVVAYSIPTLRFMYAPEEIGTGEGQYFESLRLEFLGDDSTIYGPAQRFGATVERKLPNPAGDGNIVVPTDVVYIVDKSTGMIVGGMRIDTLTTVVREVSWTMTEMRLGDQADLSLFDYEIPDDYHVKHIG